MVSRYLEGGLGEGLSLGIIIIFFMLWEDCGGTVKDVCHIEGVTVGWDGEGLARVAEKDYFVKL